MNSNNNNNDSSNISDSSNNQFNDSNINDTINTNTYSHINYSTPTKQNIITTIPHAPKKKHSYNRILFRRNKPQLSIIEE
jgi:hypothetical protein